MNQKLSAKGRLNGSLQALYFIALFQVILARAGAADSLPPNPYDVFAQEQPKLYRILTNHSARVQGDPLPDMGKRPPELQPGAIPADVRYSFAADSLVVNAAILLTNHFCNVPPTETLPFGKKLVIQPGAWTSLKKSGLLGRRSATPWAFSVWDGRTNQMYSGIVLRDGDELKQVEMYIRSEVQIGGGATVRALNSEEMRKWWVFIPFDIQEPTLLLETKDKKWRFVFGLINNQIVVLDELNGLPHLHGNNSP